ncbi:MAG TPA: DUF3040 domain-containing protein [Actinomycetota bacterium]
MPLSEHEQRILDEIERRLAEEDPKFARTSTKSTPRGIAVSRFKRASLGFIVGMGLLLAGLVAGGQLILVFGLGAFVVMLMSVLALARAARDMGSSLLTKDRAQGTWFDRFEERWRKRFERPNDGS